MRNHKLFTASFVALTLTLGGCASSLTGDTYTRDEARRVQTVRMGTIESLRPVKIEGTKTPVGAGVSVTGQARLTTTQRQRHSRERGHQQIGFTHSNTSRIENRSIRLRVAKAVT